MCVAMPSLSERLSYALTAATGLTGLIAAKRLLVGE
jgi:hypothetical protein